MRASATSRIASHAALTGTQAANNAPKADDPASFAMMLAGAAAPNTKSGDKQADNQDKQPSQDAAASDATATPQTAQAQAASQAGAQAPAKPAKDSKTDDSDDQTVAQAPADASTDPSAAMTVALQAPPQQPLPQTAPVANDKDGDDAVDGVAAAGKAAAAAAAPQGNGKTDDTDADADAAATDTAQQPQQAAAQAQAQAQTQPAQPKGIAKPGQAVEKSAARKTADASDGIKAADKAADAKADIKADIKADANAATAPQASTTDTKTADNLTLTGITAPQAASGTASQAQATPAATPATHIEVTAQPNVPALAVEIAAKSQSGAKQFDIRLDPPELGRVEVRLSIDSTGKASAHLSADQPQTLDLLQKDAPALTRALRDAGLDVSQDGLNFSLRQQNQDAGTGSGFSGGGGARGRATLSAIAGNDTTSSSNATSAYRAPLNGRLDIKV